MDTATTPETVDKTVYDALPQFGVEESEITRDSTFEEATDDPEAVFGQDDHVRFYGLDIAERLAAPGFRVEVLAAGDLDEGQVERQALSYRTTRQVFLCEKT